MFWNRSKRVYWCPTQRRWLDPIELYNTGYDDPAFQDYVWEERRLGLVTGLAEAVATYGPPPGGLSYAQWCRCFFAMPLVREMKARYVEKGIVYAEGGEATDDYYELANDGDREAGRAMAEDELVTRALQSFRP